MTQPYPEQSPSYGAPFPFPDAPTDGAQNYGTPDHGTPDGAEPQADAPRKQRRWLTVTAVAVGSLLIGTGIGVAGTDDAALVDARDEAQREAREAESALAEAEGEAQEARDAQAEAEGDAQEARDALAEAESEAQEARDALAEAESDVEDLESQVSELTDAANVTESAPVVVDEPEPAPQGGTDASVPAPEPPAAPTTDLDGWTLAQSNAIGSAESYLSFTSFSRQGLIDQLIYEGYSTEDATFAVDALEVDWNGQAALTAENYLSFTTFSRQGLIDQLLFEGFSQAEAEYGVAMVGY